jgi:GH35 family endo-1,4-beta-xylanase
MILAALALASAQSMPAGGAQLIRPNDVSGYETGALAKGEAKIVAVGQMPFSQAVEVTVREKGMMWDAEVGRALPFAFQAGESILMRFFARKIASRDESRQALAHIQIAQRQAPWAAPIARPIAVNEAWQEFRLTGRITQAHPDGDLFIKLSCGEVAQTIQIGGIELWRFPASVPFESLPATRITYEGRDPEAEWRTEANLRIADHRLGMLHVRVVDHLGQPVPDAAVNAKLTRHEFEFGSAVTASQIAGPDSTDAFRSRFKSLFNAGTFFNDLKWPAWEGQWGETFSWPQTEAALRWFQDNGLAFRGHVMIWPGWSNLPEPFKPENGPWTPDQVRAMTMAHIDSLAGRTGSLVTEWDVMNEPRDNHDLMDIAGPEIMAEWFKRAKARAPHARLALNDYGILNQRVDGETIEHYEATARRLIADGAPLDVLGLQGHMGTGYSSPDRLMQILDRLTELGRPIRITEYTLRSDDGALEEDYTRDFLTIMFSHPNVIGVQTWGTEGIFGADGALTTRGRAWSDLVTKAWSSNIFGDTDQSGAWSGLSYWGRHRVEVSYRGRTATVEHDLRRSGPDLIIRLPAP